jgi:WD40 repeat protein
MFQRPDPSGRDREQDWTLRQSASSVSVSADNLFVFAGFADMSVMVWELETGEPVLDAFRHTDTVVGVCLIPGRLRWATNRGEVWQAEGDSKPVMLLETGERWLEAAFHPGGEELVALPPDRTVKKWAVNGRNTVLSTWPCDLKRLTPSGSVVFYDNSGALAIFPEAYNAMRIVGRTAQRSCRSENSFESARLSPCETRLATVSRRLGAVEIWDIPGGNLRHQFECGNYVSCVAFSLDGGLLAAGDTDGETHIWDTETGRQKAHLTTSHHPSSLAFGPDGSWLVCAEYGKVSYFAIESGSHERNADHELRYKDLDYKSLLVLANGTVVVFRKNSIEAWDRLTRCIWKTARLPLKRRGGWERRHFFLDSCEERLVLGLEDGRMGVWSLADGQLLQTVSLDIPRPGHVSELTEDGVASVRNWGNTMWHLPGGPYFNISGQLYGGAVHLPRSADGRFTLVDLKGQAALIALDGERGVVQRMPIREYAQTMCIADDRILFLNRHAELFLGEFSD